MAAPSPHSEKALPTSVPGTPQRETFFVGNALAEHRTHMPSAEAVLGAADSARLEQCIAAIEDVNSGDGRWVALEHLRCFCDGASVELLEAAPASSCPPREIRFAALLRRPLVSHPLTACSPHGVHRT